MLALRPVVEGDLTRMDELYRAYLEELESFEPGLGGGQAFDRTWLEHSHERFPLLVLNDERTIGFLLVTGRETAKAVGVDCERYLFDLYLEPAARGQGLGHAAASLAFARWPGEWALVVLLSNEPARTFWKRVLADHAPTISADRFGDHAVELFRFRA